MRYFFSTGEASGEMSATLLARAIATLDPDASFEGIGAQRMRDAGFKLWTDTRGWGSMGIIAALAKAPKLIAIMIRIALRLVREAPDLIVLVDFGAFNLRLVGFLRRLGYRKPVLYFFPPGAWLDNPKQARNVAETTVPLVAFEHQRDFYRALGLPVQYFGHPLARAYELRDARPAAPPVGGTLAMLPGSRAGELRFHVPLVLQALQILRRTRPALRAVIGAADASAEATIRSALRDHALGDVEIVRSAPAALAVADAALVASGTAVLEAALCGVPCVAFYVMLAAQARLARRIFHGP